MMDLKTFVLLSVSRVEPVLAASEKPTARGSQILHFLDISQKARAESPTQKMKYSHLNPGRSRYQRELGVLARAWVGCKVGRMACTI